ncbi:MAG: site-specific DNA-methyltransferase, partial [Sphingomonadales bacterium]
MIWKDPLKEAYRTRALALKHQHMLKDSTACRSALPDYLLIFRKKGINKVPVGHPEALTRYAGELDPAKRERVGYLPISEQVLRAGREWKG